LGWQNFRRKGPVTYFTDTVPLKFKIKRYQCRRLRQSKHRIVEITGVPESLFGPECLSTSSLNSELQTFNVRATDLNNTRCGYLINGQMLFETTSLDGTAPRQKGWDGLMQGKNRRHRCLCVGNRQGFLDGPSAWHAV